MCSEFSRFLALVHEITASQLSIKMKITNIDQNTVCFEIIEVNSVLAGSSKPFELFDLPEKQIGIIAVIAVIVGLVGMKFTRTSKSIGV